MDRSSKQTVDLLPPKGTRDFFPEDLRVRNWLFGEFAAVSKLFGFEQFDSPVLESEALFVRKAGEEIRDQLFNFSVRLLFNPRECPRTAKYCEIYS